MSLKQNLIANYVGQGWRAAMNIAFVPLYIKYIGIESYGLIGAYAIVQSWLALLDMGMKPALSREMARFAAGGSDAQSIRDLLRSVEIVGTTVAALVAFLVWAASHWLATNWLRVGSLPIPLVADALGIMGVVTALRFIEDIYVNSLVGLQEQVRQNIIMTAMATARGLGSLAIVAWYSPTIRAFFVWQGVVSVTTVLVCATVVYARLPPGSRSARFSIEALSNVWKFAAGMVAITLLSLALTQIDKVLLTRLLPLEEFGRYALTATMVGAIYTLVGPITSAFFPRFVELATRNDPALAETYHTGAQMTSSVVGVVSAILVIWGQQLVTVWTGNSAMAANVSALLSVMAAGTMTHAMMLIPYQLQLAYGWTGLAIRANIIAVAMVVPAVIIVVPKYGAMGAAFVWLSLNLGYVSIAIQVMHHRILKTERWRWYFQDVIAPLASAFAVAASIRACVPRVEGRFVGLLVLCLTSAFALVASVASAPQLRRRLIDRLINRLKATRLVKQS